MKTIDEIRNEIFQGITQTEDATKIKELASLATKIQQYGHEQAKFDKIKASLDSLRQEVEGDYDRLFPPDSRKIETRGRKKKAASADQA